MDKKRNTYILAIIGVVTIVTMIVLITSVSVKAASGTDITTNTAGAVSPNVVGDGFECDYCLNGRIIMITHPLEHTCAPNNGEYYLCGSGPYPQ